MDFHDIFICMKKFYLHTMGCKSNQFESSIIVENLVKNGFSQVKNLEEAEIFILNSCTVTHKSDNEAFYLLRNAKHKNPNIVNVLTGCIAQVEKDELLKIDYIDFVIGNDEKLDIVKHLKGSEKMVAGDIMHQTDFNNVVLMDMTKTRASVKIQDGCDNRCSYCIIPFARGKSRSAKSDFVVEQINNFAQNGFKEVVLTGIHIGQWGKDFNQELLHLLQEIEEKTNIHRYRLGSLNPLEITDEMLAFLAKSEKFAPHFHLSLQSACDKTLRSMNRFYTADFYLEQIDKINSMFNLPFLGSDIIVGFAGETEEDFDITRKNLEKSGLTQIHTFPYSIRQGTVGAKSAEQVADDVKEQRAKIIKEISKEKFEKFVQKNIGTTREIHIEKHPQKSTGLLKGVSENYLTIITDSTDLNLTNTLQKVEITNYQDGKILGKLLN